VPGGLVLATTVRFETPLGYTVTTQLAFVRLVFAIPGALVPLAVVIALALKRLSQIIIGRVPAQRLVRTIGNSWFAIGPVALFTLAHTLHVRQAPCFCLSRLSPSSFSTSLFRRSRTRIERRASLLAQLREVWVYGIDVALSLVAIVAAEDIHRSPIIGPGPAPAACFAELLRSRAT
jgi:hypothetical protein